MRVLADWIAKFHCQYPKVTFGIYSWTADEIKEQLEKGLMDIPLLVPKRSSVQDELAVNAQ